MYEIVIDPKNFVNYYYKLSQINTRKWYCYKQVYRSYHIGNNDHTNNK